MSDLHVTTHEAARILGVSESAVRMLVMRGDLEPLCRATRPLLFREDAVVELEYRRRPRAHREHVRRVAAAWSVVAS